jgi:hypothetical protein
MYLQDVTDLTRHSGFAQKHPVYQELLDSLEKIGVVKKTPDTVVPGECKVDSEKQVLLVDLSTKVTTYEISSWHMPVDKETARTLLEILRRTDLEFEENPNYIALPSAGPDIESKRSSVYLHIQ